jgi:quercetin dioxygenase-like cupin family protein
MRTLLAAAGGAALLAVTLGAQTPGIGMRPMVNNATVEVAQLLLLPGAREAPHTHTAPLLIVRLPSGQVEYVAPGSSHAVANTGGAPIEAVVITLKTNRVRGGTGPAPAQPPGITRRALLDNMDATVSRVDFSPSAREPIHSHAYDLIAIPVRGALIEIQRGDRKETRGYAAGEAIFIPRNEPHAVANPAPEAFSIIAIAIK